jgi:hypothetical protein
MLAPAHPFLRCGSCSRASSQWCDPLPSSARQSLHIFTCLLPPSHTRVLNCSNRIFPPMPHNALTYGYLLVGAVCQTQRWRACTPAVSAYAFASCTDISKSILYGMYACCPSRVSCTSCRRRFVLLPSLVGSWHGNRQANPSEYPSRMQCNMRQSRAAEGDS